MNIIRAEEVHERRFTRTFGRVELKKILAGVVCAELGLDRDADDISIEVEVKEETEGSPSYRVGYGAVVRVTQRFPVLTADQLIAALPRERLMSGRQES